MRWDVSEFCNSLDKLFELKRKELTRLLETPPGRPPKLLNRQTRDRLIKDALESAEAALLPMAKGQFERLISGSSYSRKRPKIRMTGPIAGESKKKLKAFVDRFYNSLDTSKQIYLFWQGDLCLYVGRTKNDVRGGGGKWQTYLWRECTHFQILSTRSKRDLAKFECLAFHIYKPKYNQYKPSIGDYDSKCPVDEVLSALQEDMTHMLPLRS